LNNGKVKRKEKQKEKEKEGEGAKKQKSGWARSHLVIYLWMRIQIFCDVALLSG
jgi:hypothetical protein